MPQHEILAEFDYGPGRIKSVFLACLVTAGAALLVCLAVFCPAREHRVFFGVFACLSPIAVLSMIGVVYMAFTSKRRIVLTARSLLMPKPTRLGMSREEIEIPYKSIRSAELRDFIQKKEYFLRIEYNGGVASVMPDMLRQPKQFGRLCDLLQGAVAEVQSQQKEETRAGDDAER